MRWADTWKIGLLFIWMMIKSIFKNEIHSKFNFQGYLIEITTYIWIDKLVEESDLPFRSAI